MESSTIIGTEDKLTYIISEPNPEDREHESSLLESAKNILQYCGLTEGSPGRGLETAVYQVRRRLRRQNNEVKKKYQHLLTQQFDLINDPMYPGGYHLHPLMKRIINTPEFHRLKHLKQLGGAYYVYPGANHTRFDHSLGVSHLAEELISHLKMTRDDLNLEPKDVLCVKVAGLCHDLGQGPFSHLFESMVVAKISDPERAQKWCAKLSVLIFRKLLRDNPKVLASFVRSELDEKDVQFIEEMIYHDDDKSSDFQPKGRKEEEHRFLYEIVMNNKTRVDVEKWDRLARDSHHLGIHIPFQWQRLIKLSYVVQSEEEGKDRHIGFRDKEVQTIYEIFDSELSLVKKAYKHKAVHAVELMIADAILLCKDVKLIHVYPSESDEPETISISQAIQQANRAISESCPDYLQGYLALTDSIIDHIENAKPSDPSTELKPLKKARELILRVKNRILYKQAVCQSISISGDQEHSSSIKTLCKNPNLNCDIVKQSEASFAPEDICVEVVVFDAEDRAKRVEKVYFTPKENLRTSDPQVNKKAFQTVRREANTEYQIRVFIKNKELSKKDVTSAFECWYLNHCPKNDQTESGSGLILDKVDVCGETSLLVTNKAVRFDWKDYGLTLDIPSEVLPIDVGQCILSINASNSGDYEFPNGYHLISPVFWIRCEPNCTFKKPISMGIQHCARSKNKPSLRLVRASCTQEKLPYSFELIKPTEGKSFDANSIQLSKFSGYAIVQEGSEDLSYTSKLFYFAKDVHNCKVHFTVSKDIPSHRTEINNYYESEGAIPGIEQEIDFQTEFETQSVTLKIPTNGKFTDEGFWLVPLGRPCVTKKQVMQYRAGKMIPHCELQIIKSNEDPRRFMHQVDLEGVKGPYDYVMLSIYFSYQTGEGQRLHITGQRSASTTVEFKAANLLLLIWNDNDNGGEERRFSVIEQVQDRWREIGILLGFQDAELTVIERQKNFSGKECLLCITDKWIRSSTPQSNDRYSPTWDGLATLLHDIQESQTAQKLTKILRLMQ